MGSIPRAGDRASAADVPADGPGQVGPGPEVDDVDDAVLGGCAHAHPPIAKQEGDVSPSASLSKTSDGSRPSGRPALSAGTPATRLPDVGPPTPPGPGAGIRCRAGFVPPVPGWHATGTHWAD